MGKINLISHTVYRARVIISIPFGVTGQRVVGELEKLGFDDVAVFWKAKDLPSDWESDRLENLATGLETQAWVEAFYGGKNVTIPDQGPGFRIQDFWIHEENATQRQGPNLPPPNPGDRYPVPPPSRTTPGLIGGKWAQGENPHAWALPIARVAWQVVQGTDPLNDPSAPAAVQLVMAVAAFETRYGWPGKPYDGNHNWGALMCGSCKGPPCPSGTFETKDWTTEGGKRVNYGVCARSFQNNLDGAIALTEQLLLRNKLGPEIATGNIDAITRSMRSQSYFCPTMGRDSKGRPCCACATAAEKEKDSEGYAANLDKWIAKIADGADVPRLLYREGDGPRLARSAPVGAMIALGIVGLAIPAAVLLWERS